MFGHEQIELSTLNRQALSSQTCLMNLCLNDLDSILASHSDTVAMDKEGHMMCDVIMNVTDAGCANALVYWYKLTLSESVHIETIKSPHFYKQAAILYANGLKVTVGSKVKVTAGLCDELRLHSDISLLEQ